MCTIDPVQGVDRLVDLLKVRQHDPGRVSTYTEYVRLTLYRVAKWCRVCTEYLAKVFTLYYARSVHRTLYRVRTLTGCFLLTSTGFYTLTGCFHVTSTGFKTPSEVLTGSPPGVDTGRVFTRHTRVSTCA